jgi:hypothetical protein
MARSRTEKEQRAVRRDQLARIATLMADPVGRAYVYDLLSSCHVFQSSFTTNALAMAFSEGERNVGLIITNDLITASPDNYLLMLKEAGNVRPQPEPAEPSDAITDPDALIGPAIDS